MHKIICAPYYQDACNMVKNIWIIKTATKGTKGCTPTEQSCFGLEDCNKHSKGHSGVEENLSSETHLDTCMSR